MHDRDNLIRQPGDKMGHHAIGRQNHHKDRTDQRQNKQYRETAPLPDGSPFLDPPNAVQGPGKHVEKGGGRPYQPSQSHKGNWPARLDDRVDIVSQQATQRRRHKLDPPHDERLINQRAETEPGNGDDQEGEGKERKEGKVGKRRGRSYRGGIQSSSGRARQQPRPAVRPPVKPVRTAAALLRKLCDPTSAKLG